MTTKRRTEWRWIRTKIPQDTKNALDRMIFLLDTNEGEVLREALYQYLPVLMDRVKIVTEGRKLPSTYPT